MHNGDLRNTDSFDCSGYDADDSVNDKKDMLIRKLLSENRILRKEVESLRASHGEEGRKIYKSFIWKKNEEKTMEAVIRKFNEAFQSDKQISNEGACNDIS